MESLDQNFVFSAIFFRTLSFYVENMSTFQIFHVENESIYDYVVAFIGPVRILKDYHSDPMLPTLSPSHAILFFC